MKIFASQKKTKGKHGNTCCTIIKLGETKVRVDMTDFYYISSAIEWEVKRQINKITKNHITRVWINPIKEKYTEAVIGISITFFYSDNDYRYTIRIKTQDMVENMNKAVKRIVSREMENISSDNFVKDLQKDFKSIIKKDFKKYKLKKNYDDDYVEGKLSNGLKVKIGRTFDQVELGYIPSNPINALRILKALDKVKFEKEIETEIEDC